MRKFLASILKKLTAKLDREEFQEEIRKKGECEGSISDLSAKKEEKVEQKTGRPEKDSNKELISVAFFPQTTISKGPVRDLMDLMGFPFLALSKKRINSINYESPDGKQKVTISGHRGHFLASIYDWDIILFVAGRIQETVNKGSDIPPRTITFPRHEILKALHKHNVNTQQKELEKSLSRLQLTGIDTTIHNEDGRYRAGFGFIDSWQYTERRDVREIKITLSQWLYDLSCSKGALLKVSDGYFELTSGLERFLYRTARKHVGHSNDTWDFSLEKLYEKSGSESSFKLFRSKLKKVVLENKIPDYSMQWIEKGKQAFVVFKKSKIHQIDNLIDAIEKQSNQKN